LSTGDPFALTAFFNDHSMNLVLLSIDVNKSAQISSMISPHATLRRGVEEIGENFVHSMVNFSLIL
jgi:hypothetical protein